MFIGFFDFLATFFLLYSMDPVTEKAEFHYKFSSLKKTITTNYVYNSGSYEFTTDSTGGELSVSFINQKSNLDTFFFEVQVKQKNLYTISSKESDTNYVIKYFLIKPLKDFSEIYRENSYNFSNYTKVGTLSLDSIWSKENFALINGMKHKINDTKEFPFIEKIGVLNYDDSTTSFWGTGSRTWEYRTKLKAKLVKIDDNVMDNSNIVSIKKTRPIHNSNHQKKYFINGQQKNSLINKYLTF